jgi:hypothetical protein
MRVFKFLTKEPLSAFQANHIGCTENGFQSIAQLVPCLALVDPYLEHLERARNNRTGCPVLTA